MSQNDERQARALMLLDYTEKKQRLAVLKEQAIGRSKFFSGLAGDLRLIRPSLDKFNLAAPEVQYEEVTKLVQNIDALTDEVIRLESSLAQAGLSVPQP